LEVCRIFKTTFDKDISLKGLKIVVDCANGATYKVAPLTLVELGADVIIINNKLMAIISI